MTTPLKVPDRPQALPHDRVAEMLTELTQMIRRLAQQIEDKSNVVDEYVAQPLYGVPSSVTSLEVQPQFQRIPERIEHIIVTGPGTGNATSVQAAPGAVTGPGAGASIVSIGAGALLAITYSIQWQVEIDGTATAAEQDNFQLLLTGSLSAFKSVNDPAVGKYPQEPVEITVPAGNVNPLKIVAVAAGGAAAIYSAQLVAQPISYTFSLQIGDRYWANLSLPPTGIMEINPKAMLLYPIDRRILTANQAGQWGLELIGYTDVRNPL